MGATYSISCENCKVTRDLDKLSSLEDTVTSRKEMLEYRERIKENDSFRVALLVSFMSDHMGHKIVLYNDSVAEDEHLDYKDDVDYFQD